ncbi:carbonic anhydrase [Leisingera aquimarina]|uniref:carbonic anhydrase n=1 Tax=Leisingera aquimarina TaxID=476529 RepID=UPI000423BE61|nr:carbonic anhydrase [Leisingera aquimarina]
MCGNHQNFDAYAFSKQPGFDEAAVRKEFAKAVPLKTVVVYCYDPRIAQVPRLVAEEFGQTHPGNIVTDGSGNKIASTTNVFEVCVAGGRAYDALRSVTVAQHLFGIENIVIVHHTHCGATSFTKEGIIDAYKQEHEAEIEQLYPAESICISDYIASLEHDVQLMRDSAGTPKHTNIYGYMYDIDEEKLIKVTQSLAA